ncbi:putative transcriptional regulator [Actinobacillus equuli]|nr:putative transcriptional regulator [Actinobacillus equuli]
MSVEQTIQQKLTEQFSPQFLQIENESYMHSSGRGRNLILK